MVVCIRILPHRLAHLNALTLKQDAIERIKKCGFVAGSVSLGVNCVLCLSLPVDQGVAGSNCSSMVIATLSCRDDNGLNL